MFTLCKDTTYFWKAKIKGKIIFFRRKPILPGLPLMHAGEVA